MSNNSIETPNNEQNAVDFSKGVLSIHKPDQFFLRAFELSPPMIDIQKIEIDADIDVALSIDLFTNLAGNSNIKEIIYAGSAEEWEEHIMIFESEFGPSSYSKTDDELRKYYRKYGNHLVDIIKDEFCQRHFQQLLANPFYSAKLHFRNGKTSYAWLLKNFPLWKPETAIPVFFND